MIYFCRLIMLMAKREARKRKDMLLGKALMCFAILLPVLLFVGVCNGYGVLSFVYPTAEIIGAWYCYVYEFVAYFCGTYLGVFSFLTAVLRYRYILGSENGESVDKDKAKTTLLIIHLTIPTVVSLLNSLSNGDVDQFPWVNQCWGYKEENKTHREENDFIYYIGDLFCYNRNYELECYVGTTAANVLEPLLRVVCGGLNVFYMLFMSNMVELIIYVIIFRNVNR